MPTLLKADLLLSVLHFGVHSRRSFIGMPCAWHTVRPNKPKHQNLEHRKVYCKVQQIKENGVTHGLKTRTLHDLGERVFIGKIWGKSAGCVTFLWLVGGEVTGWCSGISIMSPWFQPIWGPCAYAQPEVVILHLGVGLISYRRTQRNVSGCYIYPLRRNQDPASWLHYFFLDCLSFVSAFPHSPN